MPEIEDSTSPLMPASFTFTSRDASAMRLALNGGKEHKQGNHGQTRISASSQRMVSITQNAPTIVTVEEKILRPVVRQFGNFKQISRDAAHQRPVRFLS